MGPHVGERTSLLGRDARIERGYGARGQHRIGGINNVIKSDDPENKKDVNTYFATIDQSVKENTKIAEKVSQVILKILPEMEKTKMDIHAGRDEDFSSIAANIIVNF